MDYEKNQLSLELDFSELRSSEGGRETENHPKKAYGVGR